MNDNLKEFQELQDVMNMVESSIFQKHIAEQMQKYIRGRKNSFFSDSLKEQWRKGGQVEGAKEFFRLLKIKKENYLQVKNDLKD